MCGLVGREGRAPQPTPQALLACSPGATEPPAPCAPDVQRRKAALANGPSGHARGLWGGAGGGGGSSGFSRSWQLGVQSGKGSGCSHRFRRGAEAVGPKGAAPLLSPSFGDTLQPGAATRPGAVHTLCPPPQPREPRAPLTPTCRELCSEWPWTQQRSPPPGVGLADSASSAHTASWVISHVHGGRIVDQRPCGSYVFYFIFEYFIYLLERD